MILSTPRLYQVSFTDTTAFRVLATILAVIVFVLLSMTINSIRCIYKVCVMQMLANARICVSACAMPACPLVMTDSYASLCGLFTCLYYSASATVSRNAGVISYPKMSGQCRWRKCRKSRRTVECTKTHNRIPKCFQAPTCPNGMKGIHVRYT